MAQPYIGHLWTKFFEPEFVMSPENIRKNYQIAPDYLQKIIERLPEKPLGIYYCEHCGSIRFEMLSGNDYYLHYSFSPIPRSCNRT